MRITVILSVLAICALATNTNTINFYNGWVVNYTIDGTDITFQLIGNNKGYIALGIGGSGMSGLDAVAFNYVNSAIVIEDRNNINPATVGTVPLDTAVGGTADCTLDASSTYNAATGDWNVTFKRKLNTGDQLDNVIVDGANMNIDFATFSSFTWQQHTNQQSSSIVISSQSSAPTTLPTNPTTTQGAVTSSRRLVICAVNILMILQMLF